MGGKRKVRSIGEREVGGKIMKKSKAANEGVNAPIENHQSTSSEVNDNPTESENLQNAQMNSLSSRDVGGMFCRRGNEEIPDVDELLDIEIANIVLDEKYFIHSDLQEMLHNKHASQMEGSCLAAYLANICLIRTDGHFVAVMPEVSGAWWVPQIYPRSELLSKSCMINPRQLDYSKVTHVLIPIACHPIHSNINLLHEKAGHFVLGIYRVSKNKVFCYDPLTNRLRDDIIQLIKHLIKTLPEGIQSNNVNIVEREALNFNAQTDGFNCGFYICSYAEKYSDILSNIFDSNFSISEYRKTVLQRLEYLANLKYSRVDNNTVLRNVAGVEQLSVNANVSANLVREATNEQMDRGAAQMIEGDAAYDEQQEIARMVMDLDDLDLEELTQFQSNNNALNFVVSEKLTKLQKTVGTCKGKHSGQFCAGRSVNHKVNYYDSGDFDQKCEFCGAYLLKSEKRTKERKCCNKGRVVVEDFEVLQNPPRELLDLCTAGAPQSEEFMKNCKYYNSEFAFGSIQTKSQRMPPGGVQTVKLNGEIVYNCSDLFPPTPDHRPVFGQMYTLEPEVSLTTREDRPRDKILNRNTLKALEDCLRENHPFAQTYKWAAELHKAKTEEYARLGRPMPKFVLTILSNREAKDLNVADPSIHTHRTEAPSAEQVAAVWCNDEGEPPQFQGIRLTGRLGNIKEVPYWDPNLDPLMFPLLFPRGTQGYCRKKLPLRQTMLHKAVVNPTRRSTRVRAPVSYVDAEVEVDSDESDVMDSEDETVVTQTPTKKREFVSQRQYLRYILQMRGESSDAFHWLWTKRTLAQHYVIMAETKIEHNEMEYVKKVQDEYNLRSILPKELIKAMEKPLKKGETLGKVHFMPITTKGSRKYMQAKYADAMAMCRKLGKPTWFLTFTGNPEWPELKQKLKGLKYIDRADAVVRYFKDKLEELRVDIEKNEVLGPCEGLVYSIEHQKRGMPHAHMLIFLRKNKEHETARFVDEFVSAEIPPEVREDDKSEEAEQARRLRKLVCKFNLHDCNAKSPCQVEGKCQKYYPKSFSPGTIIDGKNYPMYKRRPPPFFEGQAFNSEVHGSTVQKKCHAGGTMIELDNTRVVPYNPFLTLKYGSHINIEFVSSQQCVEYIFKYIMKGCDMAYVRVVRADGTVEAVVNFDEIAHYFKVRYMCPMEAMWRIMQYKIVYLSHLVVRQRVFGPQGARILVREGREDEPEGGDDKDNMVTAFFKFCGTEPRAKNLTYGEAGLYAHFNKKTCAWKWGTQKKDKDKIVVRVYSVSPANREMFCIRLLLLHVKGPVSFEALRTVNGVEYGSFEEACVKHELLDDDFIWRCTLEDAKVEIKSILKFRRFFALVVFHCQPSRPMELFNYCLDMLAPQPTGSRKTEEQRIEEICKHLQYFFRQWGTTCEQMQVPSPRDFVYETVEKDIDDMLNREIQNIADDPDRPRRRGWIEVADERVAQLNADQRDVFDRVTAAVEGNIIGEVQKLFMVEGSGGTGKTYLYNTLLAWAKATDRMAIACASTGIAALLLDGGCTAHKTFCIANDVKGDTKSRLSFECEVAENLRRAAFIIIDEITMLHRDVFDYIDKVLRSVQPRDQVEQPFGGKVILIGGDFKQLLPVVKGSGIDQINACIKRSRSFRLFKCFNLRANMRVAPDEVQFLDFLNRVGDGTNMDPVTKKVTLDEELIVSDQESLIDFVFPRQLLMNPVTHSEELRHGAILAPRNIEVENINLTILDLIPGNHVDFISIDTLVVRGAENDAADAVKVHVADKDIENINNKTPTGLPPHVLRLKVGSMVMLIRNLSVRDGLCNGTRMQVLKMEEHILHCKLLTVMENRHHNDVVIIPKVKFTYGTDADSRETPFTRIQFPVRLCFAMTVNKAQGQTLNRMGLSLDVQEIFSHGQLYVALSRVRTKRSVKVLTKASEIRDKVRNVVFKEIL